MPQVCAADFRPNHARGRDAPSGAPRGLASYCPTPLVIRRDRIVGCIVGGAIGDAWGGPYEGRPGPLEFDVPAVSACSDDTQLTLATCEAYIHGKCLDPERVAERLVDWFTSGRITGIGSSTLKAMRDLAAGAHWALAGARGEFAAGNGVAMRAAPLAFLLDPAVPRDRMTIRDIARITHHNDEAYTGALAVIAAVRIAAQGTWGTPSAFEQLVEALPEYSHVRERLEQLHERDASPLELATEFGSSGWVVESVPLAICAAQRIASEPLPSVLGAAIRAGGDTDTIASIVGQIAGAHLGSVEIPDSLLAGIRDIDAVLAIAKAFADAVTAAG